MAKRMPGGFDEENVARFVRAAHYRFRSVPAWDSWWERRGDLWDDRGARQALRAAFRDSLTEVFGGERVDSDFAAARATGLGGNAQKVALWLIETEPAFWSSPEEFEISGGRMLYSDLPPWTDEFHDKLHDLSKTLLLEELSFSLKNWALAARHETRTRDARESAHFPKLLARGGTYIPDLGEMEGVFRALVGDRVTRVGAQTWSEFPESLGPGLARQLTGIRIVIFEGREQLKHFPEVALHRWLTQERAEYRGRDGGRYWLTLPPCFVLAGRPLPMMPYLDTALGDRILRAGKGTA